MREADVDLLGRLLVDFWVVLKQFEEAADGLREVYFEVVVDGGGGAALDADVVLGAVLEAGVLGGEGARVGVDLDAVADLVVLLQVLDELADLLERLVGALLLVDLVGLRRRLAAAALPIVLLLLFCGCLHRDVQTVLLLLEVPAEYRPLLQLLIHPIRFFILQVEHFLIDKHAVDSP